MTAPTGSANILIAVSGSIASYRACELVRNLTKLGHSVRVIMTPNATEFIRPLTFEALTSKPVLYDEYSSGMPHIEAKYGADIMAIVPATANLIGKMANGIADDIVTSTYLAIQCPVIVAPAMNPGMWNHKAVQRNISRLMEDGIHIISPENGVVVCGDEGQGKLADISYIESEILRILGI
ncbi:flavoprotein [Leptospira sp. GIMC2001]|uniref:flavoprotein n=1 Tax=Leptospira sp. GIMC2001 TaxID=1513297 RepID=UPI002349B4BE|nr:flavoprotein [Leptospira sp. GIMC2001]WCL48871.1 phosphopantothenoylcysteine decarboxylase [Leptospira sp. GIMC2001]